MITECKGIRIVSQDVSFRTVQCYSTTLLVKLSVKLPTLLRLDFDTKRMRRLVLPQVPPHRLLPRNYLDLCICIMKTGDTGPCFLAYPRSPPFWFFFLSFCASNCPRLGGVFFLSILNFLLLFWDSELHLRSFILELLSSRRRYSIFAGYALWCIYL